MEGEVEMTIAWAQVDDGWFEERLVEEASVIVCVNLLPFLNSRSSRVSYEAKDFWRGKDGSW